MWKKSRENIWKYRKKFVTLHREDQVDATRIDGVRTGGRTSSQGKAPAPAGRATPPPREASPAHPPKGKPTAGSATATRRRGSQALRTPTDGRQRHSGAERNRSPDPPRHSPGAGSSQGGRQRGFRTPRGRFLGCKVMRLSGYEVMRLSGYEAWSPSKPKNLKPETQGRQT